MLAKLFVNRNDGGALSIPDYLRLFENFGFNGVNYTVPGGNIAEMTALQSQRNPIVWGLISMRSLVFSQPRFIYQQYVKGRPGDFFGTPDLQQLEYPWPTATTIDLLGRMEVDASLYGNSYWVKPTDGSGLVRLDPTKIEIATTDVIDPDSGNAYGKRLVGYVLKDEKNQMVCTFLADEVAHYKPIPDPSHQFRGASWLSSLLPDVMADTSLTTYKNSFLQNGATPNLVVTMSNDIGEEAFQEFIDKMGSKHEGALNAFKTLYLGSGADVKVVGSNFADIAMNAVQSAGETRMAMAAGVPPSLVGLSEGLQGSALNSGNYAAAKRRFSDATMHPLWSAACGALETIVPAPGGSRLWYSTEDIAFLSDDAQDVAKVRAENAGTVRTIIEAGFEPDAAIAAVVTGDLSELIGQHSRLVSTTLQKPGPPIPLGGEGQADAELPEPGQAPLVPDHTAQPTAVAGAPAATPQAAPTLPTPPGTKGK